MQQISWDKKYEIGIDVIDGQHKRIVEYINTLYKMQSKQDTEKASLLIDSLIDYTYSHFAFEEALMEEAEYEHISTHKLTHAAFTKRIEEFRKRLNNQEQINVELAELLQTWLLEHIVSDDQSYAAIVKQKLPSIKEKDSGNWLTNALKHFFFSQ